MTSGSCCERRQEHVSDALRGMSPTESSESLHTEEANCSGARWRYLAAVADT